MIQSIEEMTPQHGQSEKGAKHDGEVKNEVDDAAAAAKDLIDLRSVVHGRAPGLTDAELVLLRVTLDICELEEAARIELQSAVASVREETLARSSIDRLELAIIEGERRDLDLERMDKAREALLLAWEEKKCSVRTRLAKVVKAAIPLGMSGNSDFTTPDFFRCPPSK